MVLDPRTLPRLAMKLAATGADLPFDLVAIERAVSELDADVPEIGWIEGARLATDIRELHARLSALPTAGTEAQPGGCTQRQVALLCGRLASLRSALIERSASLHAVERARIRQGGLRGAELLAWLAERAPAERDLAIEHLLGIAHRPLATVSLGTELMDYVPSGIAPIVRAVLDVPIAPDDVFVDLGAGLGKVAMVVHLLSGARARGVELQPALVAQASASAAELGLEKVSFVAADARDVDLCDATVVFLYLPFTGAVLASVMQRLRAVAQRRALVVVALGLDLRAFDWLVERETQELWLSIYDSRLPETEPRARRPCSPLSSVGEGIARESQ